MTTQVIDASDYKLDDLTKNGIRTLVETFRESGGAVVEGGYFEETKGVWRCFLGFPGTEYHLIIQKPFGTEVECQVYTAAMVQYMTECAEDLDMSAKSHKDTH